MVGALHPTRFFTSRILRNRLFMGSLSIGVYVAPSATDAFNKLAIHLARQVSELFAVAKPATPARQLLQEVIGVAIDAIGFHHHLGRHCL